MSKNTTLEEKFELIEKKRDDLYLYYYRPKNVYTETYKSIDSMTKEEIKELERNVKEWS